MTRRSRWRTPRLVNVPLLGTLPRRLLSLRSHQVVPERAFETTDSKLSTGVIRHNCEERREKAQRPRPSARRKAMGDNVASSVGFL